MGKSVVDKGGVIVEVLAATAGTQPTRANLDAWIGAYSIPVTTVKDVDSAPLATLTALLRREYTYVVDLRTMKILTIYIGSTDGSGTPSVVPAMNELLSRLP